MKRKIELGVKKIKEEGKELQREVKIKLSTYITAAIGFVVGLAWNDAIKAFIEYLFPLQKNSVTAKFFYAALITIILVLVTAYILREPKKEGEGK